MRTGAADVRLARPWRDEPCTTAGTATCSGPHAFEVSVAPHSGTAGGLVRLEASYSTDCGATWTRADVRRDQLGGRAEVTVAHPTLAATDGYMWLRVDAGDTTGSRVEQAVERAYALQ